MKDRLNRSWPPLLICSLLAIATLAVFWPLGHSDFILCDDVSYVVKNPLVLHGLGWGPLASAFASVDNSNWHPLTWASHMLDVQLFGLQPGWHHRVNLLWHTLNTLLIFLLLKRMTGTMWRSAFVAALFAFHPLHVESVAWIAERKDVLSTFFFLLTLWAYVRYAGVQSPKPEAQSPEQQHDSPIVNHQALTTDHAARSPQPPSPRSSARFWYFLALGMFALGLMSKPMLVTLPFVLLLLDYWPLGRFQPAPRALKPSAPRFHPSSFILHPLVFEKLPFLALSASSCAVTFLAQQAGASVVSLDTLPFDARLAHASVAYMTYLQKMVWPTKLAILYLRPDPWPAWQVPLAFLLLAGITLLVLGPGRRQLYLTVGWLWFLGTLVPVIGLVQVGDQFIADRYTYIPLLGCFIILAWAFPELLKAHPRANKFLALAALLVLGAALVLTRRQVRLWHSSETLFAHCLAVTTNNYIVHNNLGTALMLKGDFEGAKFHYQESVRIRPEARGLNNLGVFLAEHGDVKEAALYLQAASRPWPELADIYCKLALDLDGRGRTDRAILCYRECLRLQPDRLEAANNLAWILAASPDAKLREGHEAVRLAEHACELTGQNQALPLGTLAAAYAEAGRFSQAVITAEHAIALATAAGQPELADRNRQMLELYRAGKPYHEAKSTN